MADPFKSYTLHGVLKNVIWRKSRLMVYWKKSKFLVNLYIMQLKLGPLFQDFYLQTKISADMQLYFNTSHIRSFIAGSRSLSVDSNFLNVTNFTIRIWKCFGNNSNISSINGNLLLILELILRRLTDRWK